MIQHFTYKPMYPGTELPGWVISFYLNNQLYTGEYSSSGDIRWTKNSPPDEENVQKMIHDLMSFHVYE